MNTKYPMLVILICISVFMSPSVFANTNNNMVNTLVGNNNIIEDDTKFIAEEYELESGTHKSLILSEQGEKNFSMKDLNIISDAEKLKPEVGFINTQTEEAGFGQEGLGDSVYNDNSCNLSILPQDSDNKLEETILEYVESKEEIPNFDNQTKRPVSEIIFSDFKIKSGMQISFELESTTTQLSYIVQGGKNIVVEIYSDNTLVGRISNGIVDYSIEFIPNNVYAIITGYYGIEFNIEFLFNTKNEKE